MRININKSKVRAQAIVRGAANMMEFAPSNGGVVVVEAAHTMTNGFVTARQRLHAATRKAENQVLKPLIGMKRKSMLEENVG